MSSSSSNHQGNKGYDVATTVLREALRQDLEQFLDADVHISSYIVAWISRNVDLADLEALVDELDTVFLVGGRSILTGKPPKR